eukprot:TRINITY_DN3171_c3_g9_i1.p1 TRINITY_DN3171_c3_g9~~TRINITY_DN3171_c3_g9_i1.p1  ORF type:complete len:396 (+),score=91.39 TRINITY_DN3171_c3_g9_i1:40-1227(+)
MNLVEQSYLMVKDISLRIEEESREIEEVLSNQMNSCSFSPDGKYLAIGCFLYKVYIFNAKNKELLHTLMDHSSYIYDISFSENGEFLATCSYDRSIIIYRVGDFSTIRRFENNGVISCICFSNCSKYIYFGDNCGLVRKISVDNTNVVSEKEVHETWICRLKFSADGKYLLSGSDDNWAKLFNADSFTIVQRFNHSANVRAIDFHPTQTIVAVGDLSMKVKLWNTDDGLLLFTFDLGGPVFSLHFLTPSILLVMSGDGYITSYDVDSYEEIQKIHCGCDRAWFSFAVSPNKSQIVCGRCDGSKAKIFPIKKLIDVSALVRFLRTSRSDKSVLLTLLKEGFEEYLIRQLVSAGIHMNQKGYNMIIDTCWDLVDVNQRNGGNMYDFVIDGIDESDDD